MDHSILIVGHGSRDRDGINEFLHIIRQLEVRPGSPRIYSAFLEFARPTIVEAIERMVDDGAPRVVVQPGMLFASGHVTVDIPRAVAKATQLWPNTRFTIAAPLGNHPKLLELCRLRWDEASTGRDLPVANTALLVAGRGSKDPAANLELERIAHAIGATHGIVKPTTCYSGLAQPLVPEAIEQAVINGFSRVVVQPFFLFDGVLVKQIRTAVAAAANKYPDRQFIAIQQLGAHPLLADAFYEQACTAAETFDRAQAK